MRETYLENSRKIFMLNVVTTQLGGMRNISQVYALWSRETIAQTRRLGIKQAGRTQSVFCHWFPIPSFTRHRNKRKLQ